MSALASTFSVFGRQLRLFFRLLRYGHPRWPRYRRHARDQALATLFHGVNRHLASLNGDYWIVYGTLLGWQREGRILPHDGDVDFGAPASSYQAILASRHRLPAGFTLHDTSHRHGGPKLYIAYQGWEADIYFFYEDAAQLRVHLVSDILSDKLPFPREWFYPPRSATFLGSPTLIPAQPELYLKHLYGYLGPNAVRDPHTGYFHPPA